MYQELGEGLKKILGLDRESVAINGPLENLETLKRRMENQCSAPSWRRP